MAMKVLLPRLLHWTFVREKVILSRAYRENYTVFVTWCRSILNYTVNIVFNHICRHCTCDHDELLHVHLLYPRYSVLLNLFLHYHNLISSVIVSWLSYSFECNCSVWPSGPNCRRKKQKSICGHSSSCAYCTRTRSWSWRWRCGHGTVSCTGQKARSTSTTEKQKYVIHACHIKVEVEVEVRLKFSILHFPFHSLFLYDSD